MQKEGWLQERLQGISFPLDRSTGESKLSGVLINGKDLAQYFDKMNWPIPSREDLMGQVYKLQSE